LNLPKAGIQDSGFFVSQSALCLAYATVNVAGIGMTFGGRAVLTLSVPFVLIFLVSVTAWSQNAASSQNLYGNWYTYPLGNPNSDPIRHEFRHNIANGNDELVVTRACTDQSRVVTAKAVSPIEVSADTIRILKSASDVQPLQGTAICEASLTAGVFGYSFSEDGEHLILTNPGGNPDYLELARVTKASEIIVPKKLYGTWLLPPVDGKEMRVQIRWVFYTTAERQDKVRQIAVCSRGNDHLVSHVDSEVGLSHDEIKVLQSASNAEHEGNFVCQASLIAGSWRYTLSPDSLKLTLYATGAKPMTLTREQESGLN